MPAKKGNATAVGCYGSRFEKDVAEHLAAKQVHHKYEGERIPYNKPHYYVPDFTVPPKPGDVDWNDYDGFVLEVKGWFQGSDRSKHLALKKQYPNLDVRFVFMNARAKVGRKPPGNKPDRRKTNAEWCEKYGFKWAEGIPPKEWFESRE